jgi:hypothetical protein
MFPVWSIRVISASPNHWPWREKGIPGRPDAVRRGSAGCILPAFRDGLSLVAEGFFHPVQTRQPCSDSTRPSTFSHCGNKREVPRPDCQVLQ